MRRDVLRTRLADEFDGAEREFAAVARAAGDLADSGRYERSTGVALDGDEVVAHLADAPDGSVAERWNWWLGSLDIAFGGYTEFLVRVDAGDEE